jgi:dihydroorotate dehydrogenase (fumarate)
MGNLNFDPPLVNSSGPWATTLEDLKGLYESPYTGAITTRTSTLHGFNHDETIHQYNFFDVGTLETKKDSPTGVASLNTLGYSPYALQITLDNVKKLIEGSTSQKPVIISVTGSPEEVRESIQLVITTQSSFSHTPFLVEINLSCPNIPSKPPPAYSQEGLSAYFSMLQTFPSSSVKIGIKTPPYSNPENFASLDKALQDLAASSPSGLPLHFITATNTLGNCYIPTSEGENLLASADGSGIGGLAGAAIHPLSLGNVKILKTLLDKDPLLKTIDIIGIGGVSDAAGFKRMKAVGASIVGIGSALGFKGVGIFSGIVS